MVDRYLLRYFLAVIDCGSFSRAAKQLNVAQPSLSVGIAKLERLLGVAVFQRTSKRVHLTEPGARLAIHARRIENEFNLATAAVMDVEAASVLRLGVISTFPMTDLADIIEAAGSDARERLQVVAGNERELLQRLSRGQVDAALTIVREDSDRFAREPLFSEHYALAIPSGHALADKSTIAAEELSASPMIVRRHCEILAETSKHFTDRSVRPFFAFRGTNDEQVLALVRAGLGVTVMPACYHSEGVRRPLLADFDLKRDIGLLFAGHMEHLRHAPSAVLGAIRARYSAGRAAVGAADV
jgi:DNA-binding transcriptional LysR family regulator